MVRWVIAASLLVSTIVHAEPRTARTRVLVTRHTAIYCGGAAPPEGVKTVDDAPAVREKILFRKGTKNTQSRVVATAMTDAKGWLSVDLPPGTYCAITTAKRDLLGSTTTGTKGAPALGVGTVDTACLENMARTCDAVIKAPSKNNRIDLYTGCFGPCYTGPMPP